jgi:hypothetical protein
MPKPAKKTAVKRGPQPDLLKLGGKWQDAVKKSFEKKKPVGGWPK